MVIRVLLVLLALAGAARADSLRIVVDAGSPVVGEMILVTIRGEYTSMITLETFVFPDSADYDWIQLANDRWVDERIGGRMMRVFEQRIGLIPRRPGAITIGPVTHHLTVIGQKQPREALDVPAEAITVEVAPFPVEGWRRVASPWRTSFRRLRERCATARRCCAASPSRRRGRCRTCCRRGRQCASPG